MIFIDNYNVAKAEVIIPASDLSNQISTAGPEASGTGNMKLSMNGSLTIGTDDGANVEMRAAVTDKWWPFGFGQSAAEIRQMTLDKSYNPEEIINSDPQIKAAVDLLIDGSLAENEVEQEILQSIYNSLLVGQDRDRYFVLKDLRPYFEAQTKAEKLYADPSKWAEYAIHNIAAMGSFSSDESIKNYAKNIWGLERCPIDAEELKRIRREFHESDRCFIA